jgi:serine/threonine protein kinase
VCGTPGFIAPEILNETPCSQKSDIFSLGCILYFMVSGLNLYPGDNSEEILEYNKILDPLNLIDVKSLKNVS